MIPWISFGPWAVGPVRVTIFGVAVLCAGFVGHFLVSRAVAQKHGSSSGVARFHCLLLLCAGCGAKLASMFIRSHQVALPTQLDLSSGYSSVGLATGALGAALFWAKSHPQESGPTILSETVHHGCIAMCIVRLGCFFSHDHPGTRSEAWFAVDYSGHFLGGARHNLALYEVVFWLLCWLGLSMVRRSALSASNTFEVSAFLAALYTVFRLCLEQLSEPIKPGTTVSFWAGLNTVQWSFFVLVMCSLAALLIGMENRLKKGPEKQ